ncbi:hypothetical protein U2I53_10535 [Lysinibacillus capsici]|uniref:hypothetical protein n=1 Tax=Lysinibacillus capsici TaxID=2115968 RepID=UPI0032DFBB68
MMAVNNAGLIQNSLKAAQQRFKEVKEKKAAQTQGNSVNSGLSSNNQSSVNNTFQNQNAQPVSTAPTVNERWQSKQTVPDYLGMTPDMIQKALAGATSGSQYYDPEQDPVYKSMLELSQKQADAAGLQAMEVMNERGILNSAITADRLGQIKQGASDAVLASIPSLSANFSNKQAQNAASLQNLLNSVISAGQFQQTFAEDNLRYDKGFDEDKRRYDKQFALDEAAVTGKYLTQGAQDAVQAILNAKQIAEDPTTPLEQRKKANADANTARQLLVSQGVNIGMLGADSSYRQAMNALNSLGGAGMNTMENQKMQANNALAVGEMTGSYTPTGAQSLVNELLRLKQENEKGGITKSEKQGNANRAQQLRSQLSSMGINADALFGANVTAQQAAANASRMSTQTEAARQFNSELGLKKDQLAFERDSFDRKMNFEESSFDRKMNFEEQQAMIEADLKSRGLDLDSARIEIDRFATQSEVQYKQQLADLEINAKTAEQNTNAAIGEALKAKSAGEAIAFIAESASTWSQSGVNVKAVLDSLEYKFPGIKDAATTSGSSNTVYGTP